MFFSFCIEKQSISNWVLIVQRIPRVFPRTWQLAKYGFSIWKCLLKLKLFPSKAHNQPLYLLILTLSGVFQLSIRWRDRLDWVNAANMPWKPAKRGSEPNKTREKKPGWQNMRATTTKKPKKDWTNFQERACRNKANEKVECGKKARNFIHINSFLCQNYLLLLLFFLPQRFIFHKFFSLSRMEEVRAHGRSWEARGSKEYVKEVW